jgi:hypothetical protein
MHDDPDPVIQRLFAEQDTGPPSDDFARSLRRRMDEQQRVRAVWQVLATAACLVVATLSAPSVAQIASTLMELAVARLSTPGAISAPVMGFLVCATMAGFLPVVYLCRTGRW